MARQFYIQDSRGYTGNAVMWWRPNGEGYTSNLDDAWKVDEARAKSICDCRETDKMWPCDEIDRLSQRYFDMQKFKQVERGPLA